MREALVAELRARVMNLTPEELPAFVGALEEAKTFAMMYAARDNAAPEARDLIDIAEAAKRTSMSESYFYKNADSLPFVRRIGRSIKCDPAGLERWIRNRRVA